MSRGGRCRAGSDVAIGAGNAADLTVPGGVWTWLESTGVRFSFYYYGDAFWNLVGAVKQNFRIGPHSTQLLCRNLSARLIAQGSGSTFFAKAAFRGGTCRGALHHDGARRMTVYEGRRTMDGLVVTVDGTPLPEHYEVKRFTKFGFEWTYEGESPQQLALAILFDHLRDNVRAIALSGSFMKDIIANLDNDWRLGGDEVATFVRRHDTSALQDTH